MPVQRCLIAAEGPHDVEFIARLLKNLGFSRVTKLNALPADWQAKLVPRSFPHADQDLNTRHPVPLFLADEGGAMVTIRNAVGVDKISISLESDLAVVDQPFDAVAAILDADSDQTPSQRIANLAHKAGAHGLVFPAIPGHVAIGPPRAGVFIMPDNASQGTLEDILLECAAVSYPTLLSAGEIFAKSVTGAADLLPDDSKEMRKPAGHKKVITGTIGSVLRPGRAIQNSIQDNRWVDNHTIGLPRVQAILLFLAELLEKPSPVAQATPIPLSRP